MASSRENQNFTETVISGYLLDDALDWIQSNLAVEDVFGKDMLNEWAEENGYEKIEEE